jgi:hypothetical protein
LAFATFYIRRYKINTDRRVLNRRQRLPHTSASGFRATALLRDSAYAITTRLPSYSRNSVSFEVRVSVYDMKLVRKLCERVCVEQDTGKIQDLLGLLVAVMRENDEEVWLRMTFLETKYALSFNKSAPDWDN